MQIYFETCIDSVESFEVASRSNSRRFELCSCLEVGGLTPSFGFLHYVHQRISEEREANVLIRPRAGNFVYNSYEKNQIRLDVESIIANLPEFGFVFGALNSDNTLDEIFLHEMIQITRYSNPDRVLTLHRCFDLVPDWRKAVDTAAHLGFNYILTSGQKQTAMEGKENLAEMVPYAKQKGIQIIVASGVNSKNIRELFLTTKADWFHGSCSILRASNLSPSPIPMGKDDHDCVRVTDADELKVLLENLKEAVEETQT